MRPAGFCLLGHSPRGGGQNAKVGQGILFAGGVLLLVGVAALLAWCIPWRTQISETQPALLFSLDNTVDTVLGVATVEGVFTRQGGDCGRFRGSIRAPGLPEGPDIELSEMIFREPPYSGAALFCTEFQRIGSGQSGVWVGTEIHAIGEIYMPWQV